ncbi:hypothetical protein JD969_06305 [Planctomycetota bacterium]|nr:hypothetical protein JD969_06305 [Planctomycetota bacterium]
MLKRVIATFVLSCMLVVGARAEGLRDYVPSDAVTYVGWKQVQSAGELWEQSYAAEVLEKVDAAKLMDFMVWEVMKGEMTPEQKPILDTVTMALRELLQVNGVMYLRRGEMMEMPIELAIICQGDEKKFQLLQRARMLQMMSGGILQVIQQDDVYGVAIGFEMGKGFEKLGKGMSIEANGGFMAMMERAKGFTLYEMYIDNRLLWSTLDEVGVLPMEYYGFAEPLGVEDAEGAGCFMGLVGKNWETCFSLIARDERNGILSFIDQPAITMDEYKAVPSGSAYLKAIKFDVRHSYDHVQMILQQFFAQKQIDEGIAIMNEQAGCDVINDLILNFKSTVFNYTDPEKGYDNFNGMSSVASIENDKVVDDAMKVLVEKVSSLAINGVDIFSRSNSKQVDGKNIHRFGMSELGFSTLIENGQIMLSMSEESLIKTAAFVEKGKVAVTSDKNFKTVYAMVKGKPVSYFEYIDLTKTGPEFYERYIKYWPALENVLPEYEVLAPYMKPMGAWGWSDEVGLHTTQISSFPLAILLSPSIDCAKEEAAEDMFLEIFQNMEGPFLGAGDDWEPEDF